MCLLHGDNATDTATAVFHLPEKEPLAFQSLPKRTEEGGKDYAGKGGDRKEGDPD